MRLPSLLLALALLLAPPPAISARWVAPGTVEVVGDGDLYRHSEGLVTWLGRGRVFLSGPDDRYTPQPGDVYELRRGGAAVAWATLGDEPPWGWAILPLVQKPPP